MGDFECQGKAPHQQGELFLSCIKCTHREPLRAGITFDFYITSVIENTQWKPNDSLESSLLSPSSLIPLPSLHILWTSKKTLWRHVIKQFFIHAPLFDDLAVCLNCSVHRMSGWASWKPILMRKGKWGRAWGAFVSKKKGIRRKEQDQRGPSRISGLSGMSDPSEWPLVREVKGTGAQREFTACKMFCSEASASSCSGLKHKSSLLTLRLQ